MADSNTVVAAAPASAAPASAQPASFVSMVSTQLWHAYDFAIKTMMTVIYVFLQPYVFFYNFCKSFFENVRDLITIGTLSIRAVQLYLQVWIRFLNGLNKDDKPAETVINTMKNIGTAANNIYKRLLDEPGSSSTHRSESGAKSTFPPIMEVNEPTDHDSANESGNGQQVRAGSPPIDAGQHQSPHRNGSGSGGSGSNGSSNGSSGGGGGGNTSPPVNGYNKTAKGSVTFDPNVKEASAGGQTGATSVGSQQGVDEVDKSGKGKTSPKQTSAATGATKV